MELGASPQYATSILEAMDNEAHGATLTGSALASPPPKTSSPGPATEDPPASSVDGKPPATKPKSGEDRAPKKARAPKPEACGEMFFYAIHILYFGIKLC